MSDGVGRYSLGVDLGTTFVAAAVARGSRMEMFTLGDRTVVTPAVVYARDDGSLVTGEAANRRAVSNPDRVGREFKRPSRQGAQQYRVLPIRRLRCFALESRLQPKAIEPRRCLHHRHGSDHRILC